MGQKEILLRDAERFRDILQKAGVEVTMDIWPDMMFMFQMADEYLAESHLALEKIGKTICERAEDIDTQEEREDIMRKNNIVRDE
jgi:acetyl esterase/lipase